MGSVGGRRAPPCAPSALTQIVPVSASIYPVFHSVIFNSVTLTQNFCECVWIRVKLQYLNADLHN